eukprot:scaffold215912_cov14-Tisochrysis_lutea.AAC.2
MDPSAGPTPQPLILAMSGTCEVGSVINLARSLSRPSGGSGGVAAYLRQNTWGALSEPQRNRRAQVNGKNPSPDLWAAQVV